jgi:hypothetical protein
MTKSSDSNARWQRRRQFRWQSRWQYQVTKILYENQDDHPNDKKMTTTSDNDSREWQPRWQPKRQHLELSGVVIRSCCHLVLSSDFSVTWCCHLKLLSLSVVIYCRLSSVLSTVVFVTWSCHLDCYQALLALRVVIWVVIRSCCHMVLSSVLSYEVVDAWCCHQHRLPIFFIDRNLIHSHRINVTATGWLKLIFFFKGTLSRDCGWDKTMEW